jgi:hypothetical protein
MDSKCNNNNNNEFNEYYSSPVRKKVYKKIQIWTFGEIVQNFMKLKKNFIAYESNKHKHSQIININVNNDNNNNKDIKCTCKKEKKEEYDFNKIYEAFMDKIEIKEKTLKKIRDIKEKEELSLCTDRPKINKNKNYYCGNGDITINNSLPVYEKLFKMRNKKDEEILKIKEKYKNEEKEDKNENNDLNLFKPKKFSKYNEDNIKELFSENNKKPNGYKRYVERNLSFLKKKEIEKKLEEDKYTGKNYEKTMKMRIHPPNITDIEKPKINHNNSVIYGKCGKHMSLFSTNNYSDISDTEDSTIEIKIPNGKIVKLKIDINEDMNKKADEFCKIFSLNDNIKKKLIKKFEEFRKYYNQDD